MQQVEEKKLELGFLEGDKITIKTNGNVGIGTTTPDANLEVVDAIHLDGTTNAFLDVIELELVMLEELDFRRQEWMILK